MWSSEVLRASSLSHTAHSATFFFQLMQRWLRCIAHYTRWKTRKHRPTGVKMHIELKEKLIFHQYMFFQLKPPPTALWSHDYSLAYPLLCTTLWPPPMPTHSCDLKKRKNYKKKKRVFCSLQSETRSICERGHRNLPGTFFLKRT